MSTTGLVYRVAPHPELDVVLQVIRELDPEAVIVVDPAAVDA